MAQTVVEILAQLAKRGRTIVPQHSPGQCSREKILVIHHCMLVPSKQTTRNVCWKHLRTQSSGWWYK
jgi:hypothetical protein